jgi:hypothetical protein
VEQGGLRAAAGRSLTLLVALVALIALAAAAAPARAEPPELTGFAGARSGYEFEDGATGADRPADESLTFGLMLGFPLDNDRTLEVNWTHQQVDVAASDDGGADVGLRFDTLTIGGTYEWGQRAVRPFVSATAGLALLSPDDSAYDMDLLFAGTLGGGVKVPLSQRVGLRFEGRGVAMLSLDGTAGVCGPGGCALAFAGSGTGQFELLAGVSVALGRAPGGG